MPIHSLDIWSEFMYTPNRKKAKERSPIHWWEGEPPIKAPHVLVLNHFIVTSLNSHLHSFCAISLSWDVRVFFPNVHCIFLVIYHSENVNDT